MTHLDLDRLADLEEDLLTPDEEGAAQTHLDECAECRARQAQLADTRAVLSNLPPEPMPAAVSARIEAALSALPSTTIVPLAASKRRGWRAHPTAAGLGAAASVAALVAALVVGRTSSHDSSSSAGGSAETAGAAGTATSSIPLPPPSVTGTKYSFHNLGRTVPALLHPSAALAVAPNTGAQPAPQASKRSTDASASPPAALSRLFTTPGALEACVRGIEGGPAAQPLAIDFATFQGAPAVLVILPGLDQGKVDAWFVGPSCTSTDVNLLRYRSLPAPASAAPSPGG